MKVNYNLIKIKWYDFIPLFGVYAIINRALEAGECRFYPLNVLRTHLLISFNMLYSIFGTLKLLGQW